MSTKQTLGRLTPVELRDAWESEAGDFTPWLAEEENIALLGETIGIDLEVEAQEKSVGPFRADILCKDTETEQWVLIENQLERTDHSHLGQLITYAAGLDAVTIVWIARQFREEHRAALDWLNHVTGEEIRFFGIQVELWRIADSPIAPRFHLMSSPNNWAKTVRGNREATKTVEPGTLEAFRLRYWTGLIEYLTQHRASFRLANPRRYSDMWFGIGRSGTHLRALGKNWEAEHGQTLRAEIALTNSFSQTYFDQLFEKREMLEQELGEPLQWHSEPGVLRKSIYLMRDVNFQDEQRWPEYYQWLHEKLEALYRVFAPKVRLLQNDADELGEGDDEV